MYSVDSQCAMEVDYAANENILKITIPRIGMMVMLKIFSKLHARGPLDLMSSDNILVLLPRLLFVVRDVLCRLSVCHGSRLCGK